jgi:cobalt-zinc-cadmium efflux system outer membrane protein
MIRVAVVAVGLAVACVPDVLAATGLTLEGALARARDANTALAAAGADVAAARGRLVQASVLAANPVVTPGANHHRLPMGESNIDASVSLGQELQIGGQRGLRIAAARSDLLHAEQVLADRARLVDGEVRRAFAGLVAAQRRRVLALDAAAQAERLAGVAATRVAHGDAASLDLDLARLDAVKTRAEATAADTEIAKAIARLATAIGAEPDETIAVTASDRPPHATPPEVAVVARAVATRPDLAAARAARDQLEGQAALTHRAGIVPNPTVRGFYSHENGHENLLGGEIEIPLPIFDRQQGAEADLRGQAASAAAQTAKLERDIPREVRTALARHRAAAATWARYRDAAVPAVESARVGLDRAVAAGSLALPDLLVQQDRLRETRKAAIDAWLDLQEAEADVIETIGENPW